MASPSHWLFKSESDVFSIDDLKASPKRTTYWEGVRNYQARNLLRDDIKKGDLVLYYHSRKQPVGVAGLAIVTKGGYPDPEQFDSKSKYYDEKATKDEPRWYCVDIKWQATFPDVIELTTLKAEAKLKDMMVCKRGARLSIQPVTPAEYKHVVAMSKRS